MKTKEQIEEKIKYFEKWITLYDDMIESDRFDIVRKERENAKNYIKLLEWVLECN